MPVLDAAVVRQPLLDFTSGYVQRSIDALPKQGDRKPWRLHQNYLRDTIALKCGRIDDGTLQFGSADTKAA